MPIYAAFFLDCNTSSFSMLGELYKRSLSGDFPKKFLPLFSFLLILHCHPKHAITSNNIPSPCTNNVTISRCVGVNLDHILSERHEIKDGKVLIGLTRDDGFLGIFNSTTFICFSVSSINKFRIAQRYPKLIRICSHIKFSFGNMALLLVPFERFLNTNFLEAFRHLFLLFN